MLAAVDVWLILFWIVIAVFAVVAVGAALILGRIFGWPFWQVRLIEWLEFKARTSIGDRAVYGFRRRRRR